MIKVKIQFDCPFCEDEARYGLAGKLAPEGVLTFTENEMIECVCNLGKYEMWVSLDEMYKIFLQDRRGLDVEDIIMIEQREGKQSI
jgi:hypothetical protein